MPKFKVGDRVMVHPYSYRGEITGTIIRAVGRYPLYDVTLDKPFLEGMKNYLAAEGEITPVKDEKAKIVFYAEPKERTVHCKFFGSMGMVAHTKSVCSPDDDFDFLTGVQIALQRMLKLQHKKMVLPSFNDIEFIDFKK
jgi:hypothetical protein|nr:MAG TPA: Nitrile hydratase beta subunit [Bacteriophage sp.]